MDPALALKLSKIIKQLDKKKRKAFEQEINAVANKYKAEIKSVPKSIIKEFDATAKLYNEFIDKEAERYPNILPDVTKDARYKILHQSGVIPRRETRSAKEVIQNIRGDTPPDTQLKELTNIMKKAITKQGRQQEVNKSKTNFLYALGLDPDSDEGKLIKKRILAMTDEEWVTFNMAHSDVLSNVWAYYDVEKSADFQAGIGFVTSKLETTRVLTNLLNQHHKDQLSYKRILREQGKTNKTLGKALKGTQKNAKRVKKAVKMLRG